MTEEKWQTLLQSMEDNTSEDPICPSRLNAILGQNGFQVGLHLAVFVEPFLQYVLTGIKTVESRFSERRIAPYGKVRKGDLIILKRSAGPVVGVCEASDVWYYQLGPKSRAKIEQEFLDRMSISNSEFWDQLKTASFATLINLGRVQPIRPRNWGKRDRRGWVVLRNSQMQERLL